MNFFQDFADITFLKDLIDNLPIPMSIIGDNGKRVYVNNMFAEFYGRNKSEIIDLEFEKLYVKRDINRCRDLIKICFEVGRSKSELTAIRGDGVEVPIIANLKLVKGENKNYILFTATDITETKQLQEHYHNIFYSLPVPTSLMDLNGKRLDTSRSTEVLFKRSTEEIINLKAEEMYDKKDLDKIKIAIDRAKKGEIFSFETYAYRGDNYKFPVLLNFSPVKDKNGQICNIIITATDITEIKEREEEYTRVTEDATKAMEFIASGDYEIKINTDYKQEDLKLLTETLNLVMEYLRKSDEELKGLIKELATPAIEVARSVIVMPLVGKLTSDRALDAMENILNKIEETKSHVGIIDITGVPSIDSAVADNLMKTMESVKLIGAVPILSGVSAKTAANLVRIGVKFDFITKGSLSEALEYALNMIK
jgi:PAS domain S-box-containing protein